jgi:outer membrane protein OmpA-like peptidoglycan-associated protein
MDAHRLMPASILALAAMAVTMFPSRCGAQENANPDSPQVSADVGGCTDLKEFSRLPSSKIVSCDKADSIEVEMPLKPDARGYGREKTVRGAYEFREYQIVEAALQERAFDTLMQLLPIAGFSIKFSSSPSTITGHKEGAWILVNVEGEYYDLKLVRVNEDPWSPVTDSKGMAREMEARHRVAVYGIEFSQDNQTVKEGPILGEVLKFLKTNPSPVIDVESHKMSLNGSAEDDQETTRKRAKAVVDWLEARGVAAGRLRPEGLGRSKPIGDNDTPIEAQRNERIELSIP